jgi:ribonuclease-3 family protein
MEQSIMNYMKEKLDIGEVDIRTYSPLALAYIGDSVFELIVRTMIVSKGNAPVHKYHQRSSAIVNAHSQAEMITALEEELTEEEQNIFHRGKNAKPATMAKNASAKEYMTATGMEAVLGYLYLTNQYERLVDLVKKSLDYHQDHKEK